MRWMQRASRDKSAEYEYTHLRLGLPFVGQLLQLSQILVLVGVVGGHPQGCGTATGEASVSVGVGGVVVCGMIRCWRRWSKRERQRPTPQ